MTNSCFSDGYIFRSTTTGTENQITRFVEQLKGNWYCSPTSVVLDSYTVNEVEKHADGTLAFNSCVWKKQN